MSEDHFPLIPVFPSHVLEFPFSYLCAYHGVGGSAFPNRSYRIAREDLSDFLRRGKVEP